MTVLTEVQTGSDALEAYFKGVANYLNDLGTEVDIATLDGTLTYSDLLTYVNAYAQLGGSTAVGLGIEALSQFAAVQRELDMTRLTKVDLLSDAAGEASTDAQVIADTATFQISALNGVATTGSQS